MDTDGHGFPQHILKKFFLVLSLFIRAHPCLKKHLMVWLPLGFWLLTVADANAQIAPADDFFHGGARCYITNNIAQAKQIVEQGRKLYPEDEKLKKLEELLKQQSQQQQQQQNQQPQNQQDQQQKSDEQKNQQQKDPEDQKKPDEQKKEAQKKDAEKKMSEEQKKDGEKKDEEPQPVKAGEMTPEEAKRLLDSQKGNEQLLQLKPQEKPRKNNRPIKDW